MAPNTTSIGKFVFGKILAVVFIAIGVSLGWLGVRGLLGGEYVSRPFVAIGFGAAFCYAGITLITVKRRR